MFVTFKNASITKGLFLGIFILAATQVFSQDTFVIQSALNNNLVLTPGNNSNSIRQEIKIKNYRRGRRTQHWVVQYSGDGDYFYLKSEASNFVLDVKNGSRDIRTPVWTYSLNRGNAQKWKKVNAGGGYFFLQSKLGHYLDVKGAQNRDGTPVWTYTLNRSNAQKWKFVPTDASLIPPTDCSVRPCQSLEGSGFSVVPERGEYVLTYRTRDGLSAKVFKAERRQDVERAKQIFIDEYRITGFCQFGNNVVPFKGNRIPWYAAREERCTRYSILDMHVRPGRGNWSIYSANKYLFTTRTKEDALRLICLIRRTRSQKVCEIGSAFSPAFKYIRD